ncbi:MAG: CBS domain-containing protein [Elusimicrobia bacterium]|nr:CBS domain-containing protein [Elusimicrobiota bacterium]
MYAADIMRRNVVTVAPEMTLTELAKLFIERKITGAPVVDSKGRLLGVISQTDLVRRDREEPQRAEIPSFHRHPDDAVGGPGYQIECPDSTAVSDVMTPTVLSADETAPVEDLARMMMRKRIHRVVITRGGRLVGIVSSMDMLRVVLDMSLRLKARA